MRSLLLPRACVVASALAVACASCWHATAVSPADSAGSARKNPLGGCAMCHVDVVDDLKGTAHLAHGVGCIRCHGASKAHAADENNEVKPDRVLTRKTADGFCAGCHKCSRAAAAFPGKASARQKHCTDCHGAHTLRRAPSREAKRGGQLLPRSHWPRRG